MHVIRRSEHQRALPSTLALLVDVELEWWLVAAGGTSQEGVWSNIRGGRKFKLANVLVIAGLERVLTCLGSPP